MVSLPSADALVEAGEVLFGTEKARNFPPAPGAHVICANKSVTVSRPKTGKPDPCKQEAYGVWAYIALSITRDGDNSADLFIEDAGVWMDNDSESMLDAFLDKHRQNVVNSIVACGEDQGVPYERTYISYARVIMKPGYVGTALTVAPYITLAKKAIPQRATLEDGFSALTTMTLSDWKKQIV